MTCIYDAWVEAVRIGHNQIQVKKEPIFQQTMFDEYIHVDGDAEKAEKVIRSIRRDISDEAYMDVYYATLSAEEDALQFIYNFCNLRKKELRITIISCGLDSRLAAACLIIIRIRM